MLEPTQFVERANQLGKERNSALKTVVGPFEGQLTKMSCDKAHNKVSSFSLKMGLVKLNPFKEG